jgi:hypothetical protein
VHLIVGNVFETIFPGGRFKTIQGTFFGAQHSLGIRKAFSFVIVRTNFLFLLKCRLLRYRKDPSIKRQSQRDGRGIDETTTYRLRQGQSHRSHGGRLRWMPAPRHRNHSCLSAQALPISDNFSGCEKVWQSSTY